MGNEEKTKEITGLILKMISGLNSVSLVVEEPIESSFRSRVIDIRIRIEDFTYVERYNFEPIPAERIAYGAVSGAFMDYFEGKLNGY